MIIKWEKWFDGLEVEDAPEEFKVEFSAEFSGDEIDDIWVDDDDILTAIEAYGGTDDEKEAIDGKVKHYLADSANGDAWGEYREWCDSEKAKMEAEADDYADWKREQRQERKTF